MLLKKWEELPAFMQKEEILPYYELLDKRRGQLFVKRLFDIVCSLMLIFILSPVILFISVWIKTDSKGTVFYRQERITQYGKSFWIYKFRTMITDADKLGSAVTIKGDDRITKVGEKIRKYRIDEIPQLFNVVKGEMSFVGTRPEVKKYVDQYTEEMKATLLLPAGITSEASIRFKDEDEIIEKNRKKYRDIDECYIKEVLPKKMKYNLHSIAFFCFARELKIMAETIVKV